MKGFPPKKILCVTDDGRNFDFREWLYYTDSHGNRYRTKTSTDGGSTPWFIWWLIPPFGKKYWFSFVLHDGCFRNSIQRWDGERWAWWTPDETQSNWLIHDAMKSQGAWRLKRLTIYIALRWFGWRAFDEDRKNQSRPLPRPLASRF